MFILRLPSSSVSFWQKLRVRIAFLLDTFQSFRFLVERQQDYNWIWIMAGLNNAAGTSSYDIKFNNAKNPVLWHPN